MKKFLDNKIVKIFNTYINPLLIGGIFSAMGNWNYENDLWFKQKLASLIALFLLYAFTSYKYSKLDKEKDSEIKDLKNLLDERDHEIENIKNQYIAKLQSSEEETKNYDKGMRELAALFADSHSSINLLSKQILEGNRTLAVWNFKKVATGICNGIYTLLCEICKPYDDFTVNIMLSDISATGSKRNITMIAHKGKYEKYPGKFEEKLLLSKNKTFYAVKTYLNKDTKIKILTTKEEVNENFVYIDEDHPDYSQYVGIPIVCSGNKIVCLLQICSFGNNKIANNKTEILDIITKYINPFTHYALLAYKIEKGFISSFSILEKLEEEKKDAEKNNKQAN